MSYTWNLVAPVFFLLVAPWIFHVGTLRGAPLYPAKPSGKRLIDFLVYRSVKPLFVLNGILLALIYLCWRAGNGLGIVIASVVIAPLIAAQLVALAITKFRDVSGA